jgi:hypothetical protein
MLVPRIAWLDLGLLYVLLCSDKRNGGLLYADCLGGLFLLLLFVLAAITLDTDTFVTPILLDMNEKSEYTPFLRIPKFFEQYAQ